MNATTLVSVEEYLRTSFPDGDREYVDGRIVERNLGEVDHAALQTAVAHYSLTHYLKEVWTGVSVRMQVSKTRIRVPDVTLVCGSKPEGKIIRMPPLVAVEVLSPDDRAGDLEEKVADYLAFGVPYVWVLNPETRRGYIHTAEGMHEAKDGMLRAENPKIEVPLAKLFET
jgi:Uma2 family endonuclease